MLSEFHYKANTIRHKNLSVKKIYR